MALPAANPPDIDNLLTRYRTARAQQALFDVRGERAGTGYDEFVDAAGNVRPAWQEIAECVGERGRGGLDQLRSIVRGLVDNDGITVQNSTRVWIDHNEFESEFSQELGPDYYDGQLDTVRGSDWITISWNYFHDHWKSNLMGNSDVLRDVDFGKLHLTYHHNYWRNCGTRGPSGRFGHQV